MKWPALIFGLMLIGLLTVQCTGSQISEAAAVEAIFAVR